MAIDIDDPLDAQESAVKYIDPDYVSSKLYTNLGIGSAFIFNNTSAYSIYENEYDVW